jgi:hypothetical protein
MGETRACRNPEGLGKGMLLLSGQAWALEPYSLNLDPSSVIFWLCDLELVT